MRFRLQILCSLIMLVVSYSAVASLCCSGNSDTIEVDTSRFTQAIPILPKPFYPIEPYPPCIDYFSGVFLGLDWGYRWGKNDLEIAGVSPIELKDDSKVAITANFNVGYGYTYCSFYLGGELFYLYRMRDKPTRYFFEPGFVSEPEDLIEFERISVSSEINSQQGACFDLLPGYLLTQRTLIFARLGIERDRFTWSRTFSVPQDVARDILFDSHDDETTTAYRLGIGVVQAFNAHFGLTANFVYIFANDVHFTAREPQPSPLERAFPSNVSAFFNARNTIRPDRYEITIGFRITI